MKNKLQLAVAYYYNGEDEKDAEIYITLDKFSDREFVKYFKDNYQFTPRGFEIYPIESVYDTKGNEYKIILKKV